VEIAEMVISAGRLNNTWKSIQFQFMWLIYFVFLFTFRFQHNLAVVAFTIPAHTQPVKSIALLKMPEGPKLLSGSSDSTVKVAYLHLERNEWFLFMN
jgi:hypothetical protein